MNIRCAQLNRINQHLINKAHNGCLVFAIGLTAVFVVIIDSFHIQVIEVHIINSAQHFANILVGIGF